MALDSQFLFLRQRFDEPTAEATSKRKTLEAERHHRIFDPKTRIIGVDKAAFDAQCQEISDIRNLEKNRDDMFHKQTVLMDQHAVFLAAQEGQEKAAIAQDLHEYHCRFQKKTAAREWDLNNPRRVVDNIPSRVGDNDPRCGPASMQKFHGEDLESSDRRNKQAAQLKSWTQQQIDEKNLHEFLKQEGERQQSLNNEEHNYRAWCISKEVDNQKKLDAQATAAFNKACGEQKRSEANQYRKQETLNNFEEIRNALDSDLLTENPQSTLNAADPTRFTRYHMKGLAPETRQAILNEQAGQRDELKLRKEQEAEEERQWALAAEKIRVSGQHMDETKQRMRTEALLQLNEERRLQAAQAAGRQRNLRTTYQNEITDDFFNKFNRHTR